MCREIYYSKKESVSKESIPIKGVSFNFRYLTDNKNYNFDYFGKKELRKCSEAYSQLYSKLKVLSENDMRCWKQAGKVSVYELIPFNEFSEQFQSILSNVDIVGKDSKIAVFRFGQNDYRIIAKEGINQRDILYIIGFDFDYSAYNHGS